MPQFQNRTLPAFVLQFMTVQFMTVAVHMKVCRWDEELLLVQCKGSRDVGRLQLLGAKRTQVSHVGTAFPAAAGTGGLRHQSAAAAVAVGTPRSEVLHSRSEAVTALPRHTLKHVLLLIFTRL